MDKSINEIIKLLEVHYKDVKPPLNHKNDFELLIAVILSARTTDKSVNLVTPKLFKKYPTPKALAAGDVKDIAAIIRTIGFYNAKARNIKATAQKLVDNFDSKVPSTMDTLLTLNGVGRKVANVVLSQWFDIHEGIAVDTHVIRLSNLLGLTKHQDPAKIEADLIKLVPKAKWGWFSLALIMYGREVCPAKVHDTSKCYLGGHENNLIKI